MRKGRAVTTMRCPVCRTRRKAWSTFQAHIQSADHRWPCDCGGYHHKHRPGSRYCHSNPLSALRHADRAGADDTTLREIARRVCAEHPELHERAKALLEQWGIQQPAHETADAVPT